MDFKYEFNHFRLSLIDLHQLGVRRLSELEELILGDSFWEEISEFGANTFIATGFTRGLKPLKVAFQIDEEFTIHTMQVAIPTIEEIKKDFCKNCK